MRGINVLALVVTILGALVFIIGAMFVALAVDKNSFVTNSLRDQKITLGLSKDQIDRGELVDNADKALAGSILLNEHLKKIAPTYADLMANNKSGKYEPTNPANLTYTQGLNMENSLNLAVLSFGFIQQTVATGVALICLGIATAACGFTLFKLGKK